MVRFRFLRWFMSSDDLRLPLASFIFLYIDGLFWMCTAHTWPQFRKCTKKYYYIQYFEMYYTIFGSHYGIVKIKSKKLCSIKKGCDKFRLGEINRMLKIYRNTNMNKATEHINSITKLPVKENVNNQRRQPVNKTSELLSFNRYWALSTEHWACVGAFYASYLLQSLESVKHYCLAPFEVNIWQFE